MAVRKQSLERRRRRVRRHLSLVSSGRSRLSVHRTSKHIYAQLIDDGAGITVASASTLEKGVREDLKTGANIEAARVVGALIAERAKRAGVETVVFDRGGYVYHGRVKALAEAARGAGLEF